MENLKILTLNIRGALKDVHHREKIRSIININKINVVLFQETHVENLKFKKEVDSFFNCQSLWSFGTNNSCGVATLIVNNFDFKFLSFKKKIMMAEQYL